jgi:hypothetical protein
MSKQKEVTSLSVARGFGFVLASGASSRIARIFVAILSAASLVAAFGVAAVQGCTAAKAPATAGGPTPTASAAPGAAPAVPLAAEPWLVEDFESPGGKSGGFWCAFDKNGLGTQVSAAAGIPRAQQSAP